jgi:hypothetical protein
LSSESIKRESAIDDEQRIEASSDLQSIVSEDRPKQGKPPMPGVGAVHSRILEKT